MNLNDWFDKGLTIDEYKRAQEKYEKYFSHILNNFSLDEDDLLCQTLKNKNIRVIAIVEQWCGHCMLNVPLLINLCEKTNTPVRFLPRDDHLQLMDQYLTNDKRIIPIFIFIDEDGNEVAKWGPVAEEINEYISQFREKLPEKSDEKYEEAFQRFIKEVGDAFGTNESLWNKSYTDLKRTIHKQLA